MVTSNSTFYSQNFEDVLLARCFPDVERGFYIDVGAQDEEIDSVTRYFYDRGWSGINIEPVKEYADSFARRQRDTTLCCAAGFQEQVLSMTVSLTSGLSSFNEANSSNIKQLNQFHEKRDIKVLRLNSILMELGFTEMSLEFLKIDVEGFEVDVIKGINLSRYRPKVILCEVTMPNTSIKTNDYSEICRIIESQNYHKTLFDGLNQWWVANECKDTLDGNFVIPPCVFDSLLITPYHGTNARKQLQAVSNNLSETALKLEETKLKLEETTLKLEETTLKLEETTLKLEETTLKLVELDHKLTAIYASRSYKLIKMIKEKFRKLRDTLVRNPS